MTTTTATNPISTLANTSNDAQMIVQHDNNGATSDPSTNGHQQLPQQHQQYQQQHQNQTQAAKQPQQASTAQKRPMNAFLLFCKRQRFSVREQYPNLENRGITKILGDCWSKLDKEQKRMYTDLARQHKEAFMEANPDFKWCKTHVITSTSTNGINQYVRNEQHTMSSQLNITQSAASRNVSSNRHQEAPKPPKKRFLERNHSKDVHKGHNLGISPREGLVPFISLDQDILDRVIDEALSEKSNSSHPNTLCKRSTIIPKSSTPPSSASSSESAAPYSNNHDEPVDFSMNRTFNATGQQIINNLVDKMLSGLGDTASSVPKINSRDNIQNLSDLPVR